MVVSILASLLSLSLISDWIKRRDVDCVEGYFIEVKNRFVQWGTCWPCNSRLEADYNRPSATFRYFMVRLPGWYFERDYNRDSFSWCRHWLHKFGPLEWRVISIPESKDGR